jgi:hypothetical protein
VESVVWATAGTAKTASASRAKKRRRRMAAAFGPAHPPPSPLHAILRQRVAQSRATSVPRFALITARSTRVLRA